MNTRRVHRWGWFVFMLALLLQGCDDPGSSQTAPTDDHGIIERQGNPDVVLFEGADDTMNRAIQQARQTYTEIIDALAKNDPAVTGLSVKKRFKATEGYEHIWVSQISWDGEKFIGVVGNDPVNVPGVVFGQAAEVTPEELSDWMYIRDGKLHGGYTIRVSLDAYPAEEREAVQKQMGFEVPPVDF